MAEQHRHHTDGYWIVWDDNPHPTWHPSGVIERDTRPQRQPAPPIDIPPRGDQS